jgi:serine/threonine-protein kinase
MTRVPTDLTTALADRYRLERELGQGGMATVYLAEDLKHTRKVAVKLLRPELAAPIGAERFLAVSRPSQRRQQDHGDREPAGSGGPPRRRARRLAVGRLPRRY